MQKQKSKAKAIATELAKDWANKIIYVKHEEMFRIKCNGDWHLTTNQKINRLIEAWLKKHPLMNDGYNASFILSVRSKLKSSLNRNRSSTAGIEIFKARLRETGQL